MASLFSKPKTPPVPPPAAIPQVGPETEDWAMKNAKQRAGFAKTVVTGDLQAAPTGKKTLLGG